MKICVSTAASCTESTQYDLKNDPKKNSIAGAQDVSFSFMYAPVREEMQ
jgi:cobyrinic acid a,c-diamide synthase